MPQWITQVSAEQVWTALGVLQTALLSLGLIGGIKAWWEFIKWRRDAHKDREQTSNQAYGKMEERYLRFLELSLQYPNLGVSLFRPDANNLSEDDRTRRFILYEMLFSVMERAYLDRKASKEILRNQWPGWDQYIRNYMERPSCLEAWTTGSMDNEVGYGLDLRFQKYMDAIALEIRQRNASTTARSAAS